MAEVIGFRIDVEGQKKAVNEIGKLTGQLEQLTKQRKKDLKAVKDAGGNNQVFNKRLAQTNLQIKQTRTEINKGTKAVLRFGKATKKTGGLAIGVNKGLTKSFKQLGGVLAATFAVSSLISFGKEITNTTAEFERLFAVLENTLGSKGQAEKAFNLIEAFAAETNFSVLELTDSFVKLTNQGFQPTIAELTNLADVANSTGKTFDQLTEAIIDAQVGEFERLKEFGIRASKEGDKVTFTFKGVKQEVDFTNQSIRDYILSLGKLNGVQGSTAKISKTLGGQISNLGDSLDSFIFSLGKSDSAIGKVIRGLVGLASATLKMLTPSNELSEQIEKQQVGLNVLIGRITDTNIKEGERLKLIKELQREFPSFIKNTDKEAFSNENLAKRLAEVNEQLVNRIILEQENEKVAEAAKEVAEASTEAAEQEIKLRRNLIEINKDFKLNVDLTNKTIEESIGLVRKSIASQVVSTESIKDGTISYNKAGRALNELNKNSTVLSIKNKELSETTKELNSTTKQKQNILKALNITQEDVVKQTEELVNIREREDKADKKKAESTKELNRQKQKEIAILSSLFVATRKLRIEDGEATDEFLKNQQSRIKSIEEIEARIKKSEEQERAERAEAINTQLNDIAQQSADALVDITKSRIQKQAELELTAAEDVSQRRNEVLKQKFRDGLISEKKFNVESLKLEKESATERERILREQFEKEKKLKLAEIAASTAVAVVKAIAASVNTFGLPFSAFALAQGGIQAAVVSSQKFHDGGFTGEGHSREEAGVVHKSEYVINKDVLKTPEGYQLASRAERLRTGKFVGTNGFAGGGFTSPVVTTSTQQLDENTIASIVANSIQSIPVTVLESDITGTQRAVSVIETNSSF